MATIRDGEKIRDARMFDKLYEEYRRYERAMRSRRDRDYASGRFRGAFDLYQAVTGEGSGEVIDALRDRGKRHAAMAGLDAAWKGGGADRGEG